MERIKLVIQYDGKNFSGFQIQPEKRTVQGELEKTLQFLLEEPVKIYASGRTDAGVSAMAQVCHFDTEKEVNEQKLISSLNALLPKDVAVTSIESVSSDFDSRFSVKRKTYHYNFYVSKFDLPLFAERALRINHFANIEKMNEACAYFVGTYDFTSFVARKSGKTDFVRTIFDCKIIEKGDGLFALEITGNGFLYNMVRIVFGTLIDVAYGRIEPKEIKNIIEAKSRAKAGKTMPSYALMLKSVDYLDKN